MPHVPANKHRVFATPAWDGSVRGRSTIRRAIAMTICIVDDHPLMREALAMSRLRPDMLIVELGHVRDLELLKDFAERPTVIFLDLNLPDAKGSSGVYQVKTNFPAVPLAVYLRDSRARHESRRKPSRSVCNPHRHQP